jgi:hypothetical protein
MFLKGVLAFAAALYIKDSAILGITIERGSLQGFATLGFMFGFWPLAELWRGFSSRSAATGQGASIARTAGTV